MSGRIKLSMRVSSLLIPVLFSACASSPTSRTASTDLRTLERLVISNSTRDETVAQLGQPMMRSQLDVSTEVWSYASRGELGTPSLHLTFNLASGRMTGLTWFISEGDHLKSLDAALTHFKSANFARESAPAIGKHYFPRESVYFDRSLGVSINADDVRRQVIAITLSSPARQPAAQR